MIFNWRTEMWRSNGREIPVRDMDERHLTYAVAYLRRKLDEDSTDLDELEDYTGYDLRSWRKARLAMLLDALDQHICQVHHAEPGDEPTDCQIDAIGRACSARRHHNDVDAATRRIVAKMKEVPTPVQQVLRFAAAPRLSAVNAFVLRARAVELDPLGAFSSSLPDIPGPVVQVDEEEEDDLPLDDPYVNVSLARDERCPGCRFLGRCIFPIRCRT